MAGMLEYKCPCCDGAIQFDSATQKMKCPYCDTEFDVDTLKGYDEELKDEKPSEMEWATPGGSWAEGETAGLHTYSCKSCGGEIVGDDTMGASACPFCGYTQFSPCPSCQGLMHRHARFCRHCGQPAAGDVGSGSS